MTLARLPTLEDLLVLRGAAEGCSLHGRGTTASQRAGQRRGSPRGRGLEFEEVRAYVPGDDLRSIHWRVTARRGRPHTKLFREERERPVWLLVDLHPGMYFGSRLQLKSALAVRAAALLTWVAVRGGDRIGAVIAGSELRTVAPRARDAGALPVLTALVAGQPRAPGTRAAGTLEAALSALVAVLRPGSLVLAISDFASLDDAANSGKPGGAADPWLALAARNECRLFAISDVLERQGLPDGRFRAGLPGQLQLLDGAALRAPWLTAWQRRADRLGALALRLRAPLLSLDTAQDLRQSLVPPLRAGARAA